jgi:hypothetical protein
MTRNSDAEAARDRAEPRPGCPKNPVRLSSRPFRLHHGASGQEPIPRHCLPPSSDFSLFHSHGAQPPACDAYERAGIARGTGCDAHKRATPPLPPPRSARGKTGTSAAQPAAASAAASSAAAYRVREQALPAPPTVASARPPAACASKSASGTPSRGHSPRHALPSPTPPTVARQRLCRRVAKWRAGLGGRRRSGGSVPRAASPPPPAAHCTPPPPPPPPPRRTRQRRRGKDLCEVTVCQGRDNADAFLHHARTCLGGVLSQLAPLGAARVGKGVAYFALRLSQMCSGTGRCPPIYEIC